jgi:hypothetical protein
MIAILLFLCFLVLCFIDRHLVAILRAVKALNPDKSASGKFLGIF